MKKLLVISLLSLTACGLPKQMAKDCGGSMEQGCKLVFGEPDREDELARSISALESELTKLNQTVELNSININALESQIDALETIVASLDSSNAAAHASLQTQINALQAQAVSLQAQSTSLQSSVTSLQTQDSVIDYLDCGGNGPGYDEVVLRTRSGKLVAYFESGSNRFLSILSPGSYATTDASRCPFTVTSGGQFCDSLGCR